VASAIRDRQGARSMKIARISALFLVIATVLAILSGTMVSGTNGAQAAVPRPKLSGGASSMDELLTEFVKAASANDPKRLERLRVTEDEYRPGILPWSVAPGQPLQTMSAEGDEYFWQVLNTKSAYHRQGILVEFSGRKYDIVKVNWEKGIR